VIDGLYWDAPSFLQLVQRSNTNPVNIDTQCHIWFIFMSVGLMNDKDNANNDVSMIVVSPIAGRLDDLSHVRQGIAGFTKSVLHSRIAIIVNII
jgi:hypothetical protein